MYRLVFHEGFEEGFKRGCEKTAKEIAGKMLENGIPPEKIADCTSLSLRAILHLARQQKQDTNAISEPVK